MAGQLSWAEALFPGGLKGSSRLDRLSALVRWYRFEKLLGRLREEGPGRPGYRPLAMFKALTGSTGVISTRVTDADTRP